MANIKRLYYLARIPWPLHLAPIFIGGHLISLYLFPENLQIINLYCCSVFPGIGGFFVILTINSNLNILSGSSIKRAVIDWFKAFSAKAKPFSDEGHIQMRLLAKGKARSTSKMESIEEKIEYLFDEITRLGQENSALRIELKTEIHKVEKTLLPRINNLSDETREIKTKINNVLVGGATHEIFGLLIIFYGLVIPLIWNAH